MQWASELQREECGIEELWVSTKCGEMRHHDRPRPPARPSATCTTSWIPHGVYGVFGETSEITGAEHICKARAATPEVGEHWYKMWKAYQDDVIEAHKTDDLSDSQPTKGNIAGGLTTIEEKALGNLEKIGRECKYIDILQPAEAPAKGPGLYYMDTSSAAAECVTLMAAGGYVVHTFPTGQGNVIGNPIVPVIKITGNPKTMRTMPEHIDVDVSGILRRDMTIPQAGDALIRHDRAHRQWPPDGGGGARPSRILDDQALPLGLSRLLRHGAWPLATASAPERAVPLRRPSFGAPPCPLATPIRLGAWRPLLDGIALSVVVAVAAALAEPLLKAAAAGASASRPW